MGAPLPSTRFSSQGQPVFTYFLSFLPGESAPPTPPSFSHSPPWTGFNSSSLHSLGFPPLSPRDIFSVPFAWLPSFFPHTYATNTHGHVSLLPPHPVGVWSYPALKTQWVRGAEAAAAARYSDFQEACTPLKAFGHTPEPLRP